MFDITRPLRVCHVMSADLWAGAEVQVATLVSSLASQHVQISAVLFNDGRLADELRGLGLEVEILDETRHGTTALIARLRRFLRDRRFDIVHTHRSKDSVVGTIAARLAGVPHVVRTVHGLAEPMRGWDRIKYVAADVLDRVVMWSGVDRVIAVSRYTANALRISCCRPDSLITIHNGVDLDRLQPARSVAAVRRGLGIDEGALVIGTAGRLCHVKAQEVLIRAASTILRERPDAWFVVAGDGPLEGSLRELAGRLGISDRCVLPGAVAGIYELIAAMDVFVLPSLHEGVPMALLEAMALRRPVVVTETGGMPEVVTHGVDGLLIPAGDDRALANACMSVVRDPGLADSLANGGRATVEERFSAAANARAVLETYVGLARRRAARPGTWALCRDLLLGFARLAWTRTRFAMESFIERRRMARLRRRPSDLKALLGSSTRLLILCQGNIIRSPFAASLVTQAVGEGHRIRVESAGVAATPGRPPHPVAAELATLRAIDLSAHAASVVTAERVAASDAIFAMDVPQLVWMRRHFPEARSKTFLLTCLAPDTSLEIRDPYAGDRSQFQDCFDHICRAVQPLASALREVRPSV